MKIFFFKKKTIIWAVVLLVSFIALLILLRVANARTPSTELDFASAVCNFLYYFGF